MALETNTQFGNYQIGEVIGEGGMGQVYRATDTSLDRDVAIKVLPEAFASDKDRLDRFEREAKTLASLNHPNIAQIFGLEKQGDTIAIVMELVEGPTLADRIAQGPIPPEEALRIARQIIDGLEAAHAKGVVHRDLKPANIKIKEDGLVKILDFGIAKPGGAVESSSGGGKTPTLVTPAVTETGLIMGTAAYMSPEQARGREVDQRTDIWAFGCLLYEMLTGQPAFGGEDVAETLARIITLEADTGSLTGVINPGVQRTIDLCLQKDLKKRLADIRDVRLSLQGEFNAYGSGDDTDAEAIARPLWRRALPVAASVLITALFMAGGYVLLKPEPETPLINRFSFVLPDNHVFRSLGRNIMSVSPDGRHFAYNTTMGLFLREMSELDAHLIPGTEENLTNPFFSPDGQSIAYWTGSTQLKRISIRGGAPVVIASGLDNLYGASWAPGDVILIGQPDGIYRVSANGGTPERVIDNSGGDVFSPELLPDGNTILYSRGPQPGTILARSLASGEDKVLLEGGHDAHYVPTGHLVYSLPDGSLYAVVFDLESLTVSGGPVPVVQEVVHAAGTASVNYAVTRDGSLVYLSGSSINTENLSLAWVDRQGNEEPIAIEPGAFIYPRISPEGDRVALDHRGDADEIWVWDFNAETRRRMTLNDDGNSYPVWSPDEKDMVFASAEGIFRKAANNTGQTEKVLAYEALGRPPAAASDNSVPSPYFYTPSGEQVVFRDQANPDTDDDIGMFTIGGNGEVEWLLREPYVERNAELSPDGRWMAYQSDESGRYEIYVRPFPNVNDDQVQVSNAGGVKPLWSRDGRELFYLEPVEGGTVQMMAVSVIADDNRFRFSERTKLLDWPLKYRGLSGEGRSYDVSVDGQRFLALKIASEGEQDETAQPEFVVVQNWIEDLKRLAPVE